MLYAIKLSLYNTRKPKFSSLVSTFQRHEDLHRQKKSPRYWYSPLVGLYEEMRQHWIPSLGAVISLDLQNHVSNGRFFVLPSDAAHLLAMANSKFTYSLSLID